MSALNFVLTNAGRAAISQVGSLGPVVISQVALGSNGYIATVSQSALQAQIKRLTPAGSSVPTAGTIHITVQDNSADAYTVREIGIYTSTGALFAVYSQTDSILIKASTSVALFALDIVIANVPAGSVTIGNATFQYPPATESVKGVAELATNSEVQTGTDAERIVTPAGLSSRTASDTRTGLIELATNSETQTGTDPVRAVSPAALSSRTATTERTGLVELATDTEVATGTDSSRAVTPANLKNSLAVAKAWVNFNGTFATSPLTIANNGIIEAYNVSSVIDNGVGNYTINFVEGIIKNNNYIIIGYPEDNIHNYKPGVLYFGPNNSRTLTSCQIFVLDEYAGQLWDSTRVQVLIYGGN